MQYSALSTATDEELLRSLKILIINLDRAKDRWERICETLTAEGVQFERLEAVDGALEEQLCRENNYFPVPVSKWFRPLTLGEIGCSLSHRKAWDKIIAEQLPYALILEDDFILEPNWKQGLLAILRGKPEFDVIKLSRAKRSNITKSIELGEGFTLGHSFPVPIESIATLVSFSGAVKLRKGISKVLRPLDFEFKNYWEYDLQLYSIYPNLFTQVELEVMDSYIGNRAQYRDYPLLKRITIYLRKYAYQVIHRWRLTKYKLLLK